MGSSTQIHQDDFKAAMKEFAWHIRKIEEELESIVKSTQVKAAELYESACL